jgi:hypothetical protein
MGNGTEQQLFSYIINQNRITMKKTYRITFDITIDPKFENLFNPLRLQGAILDMIEKDCDITYPKISQPSFTLDELEQLGRLDYQKDEKRYILLGWDAVTVYERDGAEKVCEEYESDEISSLEVIEGTKESVRLGMEGNYSFILPEDIATFKKYGHIS